MYRVLSWKPQWKIYYWQRQFPSKTYQFCSLPRSPSNKENTNLFLLFYLGLPTHFSPLIQTSFLQSRIKILVDNCLVVEKVWIQEAIDFVLIVGISTARKSKGLPFISTFRLFNSHFFLTVVFFFLLQCFNLQHDVFN